MSRLWRISSRKIKFYWRHHNKFLELKVGKAQALFLRTFPTLRSWN